MLRSLSSLIKGRFNPDVIHNDQHVGQPNPVSVRTVEACASEPETSTSAVNVVTNDVRLGSHALGESSQALREGEQTTISQDSSELVEQGAALDAGDTCTSHMDTVGSSDRFNEDQGTVMRTKTVCVPYLRDASAVNMSTAADFCTGQHQRDTTIDFQQPFEKECQREQAQQLESSHVSVSQQVCGDTCKPLETDVESTSNGIILRSVSAFSADSLAEYCRICQQPTDEPLMELGCHCRGELSKTHRTCIQQWFNNKGTNKCEVCQHVAANFPPPAVQTMQRFWTWRISRPYGRGTQSLQGRFHPLWAALLILVAGLLFDVLISYYLGASALPVNIIIGVLVVLGLGTAARLIVECWREQRVRRSIRRLQMAADMDQLQSDDRIIGIHLSS